MCVWHPLDVPPRPPAGLQRTCCHCVSEAFPSLDRLCAVEGCHLLCCVIRIRVASIVIVFDSRSPMANNLSMRSTPPSILRYSSRKLLIHLATIRPRTTCRQYATSTWCVSLGNHSGGSRSTTAFHSTASSSLSSSGGSGRLVLGGGCTLVPLLTYVASPSSVLIRGSEKKAAARSLETSPKTLTAPPPALLTFHRRLARVRGAHRPAGDPRRSP